MAIHRLPEALDIKLLPTAEILGEKSQKNGITEEEGNQAGRYKTTLWSGRQGALRRQRIQDGCTVPEVARWLGHGRGRTARYSFTTLAHLSWVLDETKSLLCILMMNMNLNIIRSLKFPCYVKISSPQRLLTDGATCLGEKTNSYVFKILQSGVTIDSDRWVWIYIK